MIMGIVNINDDSFAGDGSLDIEQALALARSHVAEGADIIDVGGESARTNRLEIGEDEELARILPFVKRFGEIEGTPVDENQLYPPLLSINTWRAKVAAGALGAGGQILNDLSALPFDQNARIAARHGAALLIMHSVGLPKQKQTHVFYQDVLGTIDTFFEKKIDFAMAAGLERNAIILDPGIDFAKQRLDNLLIFRHLDRLKRFERPVLLPVSRKTVIGETLGIPDPQKRDAGTVACVIAGLLRGASIFRAHNVHAVSQALRVAFQCL
jgi:dihydropteroate synthase